MTVSRTATTPSRAARGAAARRRRGAATAVVVVTAAVVFGITRLGGGPSGGPSGPDGGTGSRRSELLVLQVVGTADPLLAMVGTGPGERDPSFFSVPFDLMLTVPGQGEARAGEVAALDGEAVRVALSNTFGAWGDHVAVLDLEGLSAVVDRADGLDVLIPGFYATEEGELGPGRTHLSGPQVVALLGVRGEGAEARWASVVQGLLRRPLRLDQGDLTETDGLAGVRRVLRGARGATLATFPTTSLAGRVLVPLQPDFDRQVARHFGGRTPVPVIVENGVGVPGLGQDVATVLLPLGYRVVVSQNADLFGYERTRVVANGAAAVDDARRIQNALGVGRVGVSQVPSGIGDITIIVGEDFTG